jgi:hypothetical protein
MGGNRLSIMPPDIFAQVKSPFSVIIRMFPAFQQSRLWLPLLIPIDQGEEYEKRLIPTASKNGLLGGVYI